jgi:hypothetical protein
VNITFRNLPILLVVIRATSLMMTSDKQKSQNKFEGPVQYKLGPTDIGQFDRAGDI